MSFLQTADLADTSCPESLPVRFLQLIVLLLMPRSFRLRVSSSTTSGICSARENARSSETNLTRQLTYSETLQRQTFKGTGAERFRQYGKIHSVDTQIRDTEFRLHCRRLGLTIAETALETGYSERFIYRRDSGESPARRAAIDILRGRPGLPDHGNSEFTSVDSRTQRACPAGRIYPSGIRISNNSPSVAYKPGREQLASASAAVLPRQLFQSRFPVT